MNPRSSSPIAAFDIETIPDVEALRASRGISDNISDKEVVEMDARLRRQEKNNDFLPPHFQRIAVISCAVRYFDEREAPINVFSLGAPEDDEQKTITKFFFLIEKLTPQLVSWNGGGFDLPVLQWRAMKFGISAPRYWQNHGEDEYGDKFRWNNYFSRYHERHLDLMDVMGMYQSRAKLEEAARLCGLPGKIGIGGDKVWETWQAGKHEDIRLYCENDTLLTYLLFVRFQHFRGDPRYPSIEDEHAIAREYLNSPRWDEFWAKCG